MRLVWLALSLLAFAPRPDLIAKPSFIAPPGPAAPSHLPLADLFSIEKNPGAGTLEYQVGEAIEKVSFGMESGHYALGMVFSKDTLPPSVKKDFRANEVLQLAFGTHSQAAAGKVTQFGSATVLVAQDPGQPRSIPLVIPTPGDVPLAESGFLLFTSPDLQAQISDEEKLKSTFFAKVGSIRFKSVSPARTIYVPIEGKKIPFKMQGMELEIQAGLATPFNSEERQLRGQLEIPLYWPQGKLAKELARRLADRSFNSQSSIDIPEEWAAPRKIATPTSQKKH